MGEYPRLLSKEKYDALVEKLKVLSDSDFVDRAALAIDSAAFFRRYTHFDDEAHAFWKEADRRGNMELYSRAHRMAVKWNEEA